MFRSWKDMSPWLRVLTALLQDPGSNPSKDIVAHNYLLELQFQRIGCPLLASMSTRYTGGAKITIHTHKVSL